MIGAGGTAAKVDAGTAGKVDAGLASSAAALSISSAPAAAAPPGAPGAPAAQPINWRQDARELWKIVAMLGLRYPTVDQVFTDEQLDRLAETWAPVLERHNLDLGKFMIYFVAGTSTLPVVGDLYKAIKHDRLAEAAAGDPPPVPAARSGTAPAAAAATSRPPVPPAVESAIDAPPAPPDTTKLHQRA